MSLEIPVSKTIESSGHRAEENPRIVKYTKYVYLHALRFATEAANYANKADGWLSRLYNICQRCGKALRHAMFLCSPK